MIACKYCNKGVVFHNYQLEGHYEECPVLLRARIEELGLQLAKAYAETISSGSLLSALATLRSERARIKELEAAIRAHCEEHRHFRYRTDERLYAVLGEKLAT